MRFETSSTITRTTSRHDPPGGSAAASSARRTHPIDVHAVNISEILLATDARDHRLFTGRLDTYGFGERAVALAVTAPERRLPDREAVAVCAGGDRAALASQAPGRKPLGPTRSSR